VQSRVVEATGNRRNGVDEVRWFAPVAPGDTLRVRGEIVAPHAAAGRENAAARSGASRRRLKSKRRDRVLGDPNPRAA